HVGKVSALTVAGAATAGAKRPSVFPFNPAWRGTSGTTGGLPTGRREGNRAVENGELYNGATGFGLAAIRLLAARQPIRYSLFLIFTSPMPRRSRRIAQYCRIYVNYVAIPAFPGDGSS